MEKPEKDGKRANESGIEIKPVYSAEDIKSLDPARDIGLPGEYPYLRGIHKTMYRDRLWTMRQYSGFGTPEDSNRRYKYLLAQGQMGLSVALDLPTQMGLDPDDPMALGEVGRVGVSISTLQDMEILFDGLSLDKITTSFTINATAPMLLAMYLCVAEKQGVPFGKVGGTIQNDILKEYVARGAWIYPPEFSMRLIADTIEYCARHVPRFNSISISGAHFRDAGCTAAQEGAFTLADAVEYIRAALARGLDIDAFAPQLSFYFYTHNNFFEEVAKYRAMRKIWAALMKEKFQAKNPRSCHFRFGVVCGGSTLMPQQHEINTVRVAYQALASVLGGVQSMFTAAMDEPFSIPTEETARLALRTQQVLAFETGVADTADPLGGSYYVEALTKAMQEQMEALMARIDARGGMIRSIQEGWVQKEILEEAYKKEKRIRSGEIVVVGVNRFTIEEEEKDTQLHEYDPRVAKEQVDRLHQARKARDAEAVKRHLEKLRNAARGNQNLMPYLIAA
ncbi:MAG: methylmalonyl-CoA mutase family protein, partial [Deltaproteobacteria bacterium]|nr:methylmalonyl-CoA mutase family protein [Deltaproteobacteria bacterium]